MDCDNELNNAFGDIENCDALPRTAVDLSLLKRNLNQFTFCKTQRLT